MKPTKEPPPVTITFPVLGIDTSCEYSRQPPRTTPIGNNVRSFDRMLRMRGGSRPGLSKLIPGQVSGTHHIQHLAVLVDPTVDAVELDQDYEDDDNTEDYIDDPSTNNGYDRGIPGRPGRAPRRRIPPGRRVRRGGSGRNSGRNRKKSGRVRLLQVGHGSTATNRTTFGRPVRSGSLLVIFLDIGTASGGGAATTVITDTLGNTYSQAGTSLTLDPGNTGTATESIWYTISRGDGACIITSSNAATTFATALEFGGIKEASPLDGFSKNSFTVSGANEYDFSDIAGVYDFTTGVISILDDTLVVAYLLSHAIHQSPEDFVRVRIETPNDGDLTSNDAFKYQIGAFAATEFSGTTTLGSANLDAGSPPLPVGYYMAIGASFKVGTATKGRAGGVGRVTTGSGFTGLGSGEGVGQVAFSGSAVHAAGR